MIPLEYFSDIRTMTAIGCDKWHSEFRNSFIATVGICELRCPFVILPVFTRTPYTSWTKHSSVPALKFKAIIFHRNTKAINYENECLPKFPSFFFGKSWPLGVMTWDKLSSKNCTPRPAPGAGMRSWLPPSCPPYWLRLP